MQSFSRVATVLQQLLPYQPVTLSETSELSGTTFCVAIRIDEPLDLYYIAQFICLNKVDTGTPVYDEGQQVVCFPELVVDADCYDLIINHGPSR